MKGKNAVRKLIAVLLGLCLIFTGTSPVFASQHDSQVRVIVENTTYTVSEGAAWEGTLVDTWVDIDENSTMMSCVMTALNNVGATQSGAENNYISSINGLEAGSAGGYDGWMGTLNDWFVSEGFAAYTVAAGTLKAKDEIRIMYSLTMGEDLGGSWSNNDKTLKDIAFSVGTLDQSFDKNVGEYTLTFPASTQSIIVTPTASNKNFMVTQEDGIEYSRSEAIPVEDGSVITVVCGDPAWPSMNGGSYGSADAVPKQTYTFNVSITQLEPSYLEFLTVHTGMSPTDSGVLLRNASDSYSTNVVFDPQTFTYTLQAQPDTLTQLRFRAKPADSGATVTLYYGEESKDITWSSGSSKWANCLTNEKNVLKLVVTPADDTKAPATYTIIINSLPTISSLNAFAEDTQLYFDQTFSASKFEYTLTVPKNAQTVTFTPVFKNEGYEAEYNGFESNTVDISQTDKVVIDVYNSEGNKNTYTINLNKVDSLDFKINVTPQDAVIKVYDHKNAEVAPNDDGSYSGLFSTYEYTYSITKYGYISTEGSVPSDGGVLNITLTKNPENTLTDVGSEWFNFRNSNANMGITDAQTPVDAADTSLLWAAKLGSGWTNAPSVQIIVDDSLIVMSSNKIYKLDLETGEILASADMVASPSYGYTPPTYAEGMIFCPLGGGIVQAFNAETLESLWVYTDNLGGQALSPITYSDGYIYTGFWYGEARETNFVCISISDDDPSRTDETKYATWTHTQMGGFYWAGSVVIDDCVYVGTDDGQSGSEGDSYIYSFDKRTGEIINYLTLNGAGDQRSSIAYDSASGKIYFTTKGGFLFSAYIDKTTGALLQLSGVDYNAQSTSTPIVYDGKVYFATGSGISSSGSSGNFVAADADTLQMLYYIGLKGYPQCSMLLSTAYEDEGYLYFYSTYNNRPGGISMIKVDVDAPVSQQAQLIELYDASGYEQYCIASLICDSDGNLYYKNDSGYVLAVGVPKATQVINLIEAIGEVNADSGSAIKIAQDAYNALSDEDKAKVTNYQDLLDAISAYNNLKAGQAIDAINAIGTVTLESESAINNAVTIYNSLTDEQKNMVSNYSKLLEAVNTLSELKVEHCISLIEAIGEVTIEKEKAVVAARSYYSTLNTEESKLVTNYDKLTEAEALLAKLKSNVPSGTTSNVNVALGSVSYGLSEATQEAIEKIQVVLDLQAQTDSSEINYLSDENLNAVIEAYKAYEMLSNDEKLFVENYEQFEQILDEVGVLLKSDDNTGIKASNAEWNLKLIVEPEIISADLENKITDKLNDSAKVISLNDIYFIDVITGERYTPSDEVIISVPMENIGEFETYVAIHIDDNQALGFIEASVENGAVTFTAHDFSLYAIAGFDGSWSDIVPKATGTNLTWLWVLISAVAVVVIAVVLIIKKRRAS